MKAWLRPTKQNTFYKFGLLKVKRSMKESFYVIFYLIIFILDPVNVWNIFFDYFIYKPGEPDAEDMPKT